MGMQRTHALSYHRLWLNGLVFAQATVLGVFSERSTPAAGNGFPGGPAEAVSQAPQPPPMPNAGQQLGLQGPDVAPPPPPPPPQYGHYGGMRHYELTADDTEVRAVCLALPASTAIHSIQLFLNGNGW